MGTKDLQVKREYRFSGETYEVEGYKDGMIVLFNKGGDSVLICDSDFNVVLEFSADCNQNYGFMECETELQTKGF